MNNIDHYTEIEIINCVGLLLQSHKTIKDQSNNLKRYGISAESIIKEYDKSPNPTVSDLIVAILNDIKEKKTS